MIAILTAEPAGIPNTLTVINTGSSVVSESTTLQFKFIMTGKMNPNDYFHLIFDDNFGVTSLNIYWDSSVTSTAFFYLNKTEIETILSTDGKTKTGVYIYVNKKFVPPGSNAVFI